MDDSGYLKIILIDPFQYPHISVGIYLIRMNPFKNPYKSVVA